MLLRVTLATATIPSTSDELRLVQRGNDFIIMLGRNELMSSRLSGSEVALADLSLDALRNVAAPRMMIGGLGMGFTLRAALARLPKAAKVTVVELVPEIVDWARGPLAPLHGSSLDDPRVTLAVEDVTATIARDVGAWDSILLDVDNGPDGLTRPSNDGLYSDDGLALARRALRPGGNLAVWSAYDDPAFTKRLQRAGFDAVPHRVRATGTKGAHHTVWIARKRG